MKSLQYARQSISTEDISAVERVLLSDCITQGPAIEEFEARIAEFCNVEYALAVTSGTAALHLGALALGLKPSKKLWTSPNSFVASSNCAYYCGADVDFVDIDEADGNMSADKLEQKLALAEKSNLLPDVVVPVHFAGQHCDMDRIEALSRKYQFRIMEDASHALGAQYKGTPIGNSGADLTVLSFHPVKIITTGEGGAILTNSNELFSKIRDLRSHGISRDHKYSENFDGPWSYVQTDLGFNYRMTDLQAALGLSQMNRVEQFVDRRNYLWERYETQLADLPVRPLLRKHMLRSACHLFVVRLESPKIRKRVFEELLAEGIIPQVHYIPIHTQPYYRNRGFKMGDFPAAEWHYGHSISLPLFPAMSDGDQDRVVASLKKIL